MKKKISCFLQKNIFGKNVVHRGNCLFLVQLLSHVLRQSRLPRPSLSPRVCSDSCPLSRWYHPTISSPVVPFSSCPQCLPASGSFPMNQLFASSGQSIGASASASVLPMNIQGLFPSGLTGLIPSLSKGVVKVFSSTTIQRHLFLLGNSWD